MMNFNEFKETLRTELERKTNLEETVCSKYGYGEITAFIIGNGNQRPTIYPHIIYSDYYKTGIMDMKQLVEHFMKCVENAHDVPYPKTKEEILSTAFPRLLCKEKFHGDIYKEVSWSDDVIITYCCMIACENEANSLVVLNSDFMNCFHISMEELEQTAMNNLKNMSFYINGLNECIFHLDEFHNRQKVEYPMKTIRKADTDVFGENLVPLFILSNEEIYYGATVLLREDILQILYDYFGKSYAIIPSSVNEVILILDEKESIKTQAGYLKEMIREVNGGLSVELYLSNNLYFFDGAKLNQL